MRNILFFVLFFSITTANANRTKVKISFVEALSHKDTTSSKRFRKEYQDTIKRGLRLANKKVKKCGYQLSSKSRFFESSDSLQALEMGKSESNSGAWLIVSPRRSNHYLLLIKGSKNTPTLSIMASAKEVFDLPKLNLTMSPSNHDLAKIAAIEAKKKVSPKKTYVTILKEGCLTCEDFSSGFDIAAQNESLEKIKEFKVIGKEPNIESIKKELLKISPSIILLPNYSKISAYLMKELYASNPKAIFVGGDGWGDKHFGFVQNNPAEKPAFGITVRGFIPTNKALGLFELGQKIKKTGNFPKSSTSLALFRAIDGVTNLLCKYRPKNKSEFSIKFQNEGKSLFAPPWGIGVYHLKNDTITYSHRVKID